MPKVTVIMPCLNVVPYIEACVESVLAQTLTDLEILIIDAGSEDGTLEILQKYEAADSRIKLIHSEKKSYGYQVNTGISLAQGEYVGIVETDDKIIPSMYEILYHKARETDADYVKGRGLQYIEMEDGRERTLPLGMPLRKALFGKLIMPCNMPELILSDVFLWTGIYKKKFIRKILLNETKGAAFQDQGFLFQTISSAHKAVYLDQDLYLYRQDNLTASSFNKRGFHYLAEEYTYIKRFLKDMPEAWTSIYYQRMLDQCLGRFYMMALSGSFWEDALPDIEIHQKRLQWAVGNKKIAYENMEILRWQLLELLLKSPYNIYEYYIQEIKEKADLFQNIVRAGRIQGIVLFGGGIYGRFLHIMLDNINSQLVLAYCDNDRRLCGTEIQEILVLTPKAAVEKYPEAFFVITSERYFLEMQMQLVSMGIKIENIMKGVFEIDTRILQGKEFC